MRLFEPWSHEASLLLIGLFLSHFSVSAQEDDLLLASIDGNNELANFHHLSDWNKGVVYWADTLLSLNSEWNFSPWNTKLFNPYKDESLEYPFHISFSEETFASPVDGRMVITSRYGWRNGMLHRGIDIDLESGDEVRSMLSGKVRYVKSHAGHGKTIVIRHQNGLETIYAHLSRQLVSEDDIVEKGQVIGKGGTTGNARGSHLHLEVRYLGRTINPEYFFEFDENVSIRAQSLWVTYEKADPRHYSSFRKPDLALIQQLEVPLLEENQKASTAEGLSPPAREMRVAVNEEIDQLEVHNKVEKTESPEEHSKDPFYVIQYGDTIYSLARKYKVKIEDLCRVNGISDSFKIKAGQRIQVMF